jgi:SAM-dependent methyltransferase
MTTSKRWQLAQESAMRYQNILAPAILGPFARALVDFAALRPHESVVDVGCGTGEAARYAAGIVGHAGVVIGVDVNASMISVARSVPFWQGVAIDWRVASATQLPLDDQSVDVALCAQTLQFLAERRASLVEMRRVVKPTGRVAISLWCDIEENPYFYSLVEMITCHIGPDTAAGLKMAFSLTNPDRIQAALNEAGFGQIKIGVEQFDLPLPPLAEFVPRHISATPMDTDFGRAPRLVQQAIVQGIVEQLVDYQSNGRAQIPFKSYMILARA